MDFDMAVDGLYSNFTTVNRSTNTIVCCHPDKKVRDAIWKFSDSVKCEYKSDIGDILMFFGVSTKSSLWSAANRWNVFY